MLDCSWLCCKKIVLLTLFTWSVDFCKKYGKIPSYGCNEFVVLLLYILSHLASWKFMTIMLYLAFHLHFNWIYWDDYGSQNQTGFKCTVQQNILLDTVWCVHHPEQILFLSPFIPPCPPPSPLTPFSFGYHHIIVCVCEIHIYIYICIDIYIYL